MLPWQITHTAGNGRVGFRKIGNSTRIRELGSGFTVQTVSSNANSSKMKNHVSVCTM